MALNCWEHMQCGREPGGRLAAEKGVCPAATYRPADGFLGGCNGGRACCFVHRTLCAEAQQGTYREKSRSCWDCEFYRMLRREHGGAFSMSGFALHLLERDETAFRTFIDENRPPGPETAAAR